MVLKSTKLIKLKKKRKSPVESLIGGGITALIGIAFFSELVGAIRRL